MTNTYWKIYDNGERANLIDNDKVAATIDRRYNNAWKCNIFYNMIEEEFYWHGFDTIEEVEWQVTWHINTRCNEIINQAAKIRDHLPSLHELARIACESNPAKYPDFAANRGGDDLRFSEVDIR